MAGATISAFSAGPRLRNWSGYKDLAKWVRPTSRMGNFLMQYAWKDAIVFDDDAQGAASSAIVAPLITNGGTGTTAFAIPSTPLQGGAYRAVTGTNATASNRQINLYGPNIYLGNNNCGMEARFKISAVTHLQFEVGFIDTMTSIATPAPAVTDIDVPSFAAGLGDCAVVAMDTSQTLTTMGIVVKNSNASTSSTTTIVPQAGGTLTPTAATYMTVRVQLEGSNVVVLIDDETGGTTYTNQTVASGIYGATLVRPWVYVGDPDDTTSKNFDLDRLRVWMDR